LVSVDVEASGPVPGRYSLLAIGACLLESTDKRFYIELKPSVERFDPTAVEISWPEEPAERTLARLRRDGIEPDVAIRAFRDWVLGHATDAKPVSSRGMPPSTGLSRTTSSRRQASKTRSAMRRSTSSRIGPAGVA
jgi:hypothetical protein